MLIPYYLCAIRSKSKTKYSLKEISTNNSGIITSMAGTNYHCRNSSSFGFPRRSHSRSENY
jgi:hypothetical protein